jgi:hypothetical protein
MGRDIQPHNPDGRQAPSIEERAAPSAASVQEDASGRDTTVDHLLEPLEHAKKGRRIEEAAQLAGAEG